MKTFVTDSQGRKCQEVYKVVFWVPGDRLNPVGERSWDSLKEAKGDAKYLHSKYRYETSIHPVWVPVAE